MKFHARNEHTRSRPIVRCPRCKRTFKHSKSLKIHEDQCKGVMKRLCDECGEELPNSVAVANHKRMHSKQRQRDMAAEASRLAREKGGEKADDDDNDDDNEDEDE